MLGSRSPGSRAPVPITSNSPSMLFSWDPPRKTPEPEPSVIDRPAAIPVASITETWVVPVSSPFAGAP